MELQNDHRQINEHAQLRTLAQDPRQTPNSQIRGQYQNDQHHVYGRGQYQGRRAVDLRLAGLNRELADESKDNRPSFNDQEE